MWKGIASVIHRISAKSNTPSAAWPLGLRTVSPTVRSPSGRRTKRMSRERANAPPRTIQRVVRLISCLGVAPPVGVLPFGVLPARVVPAGVLPPVAPRELDLSLTAFLP